MPSAMENSRISPSVTPFLTNGWYSAVFFSDDSDLPPPYRSVDRLLVSLPWAVLAPRFSGSRARDFGWLRSSDLALSLFFSFFWAMASGMACFSGPIGVALLWTLYPRKRYPSFCTHRQRVGPSFSPFLHDFWTGLSDELEIDVIAVTFFLTSARRGSPSFVVEQSFPLFSFPSLKFAGFSF